MEQAIEQSGVETATDKAKFEVALTEALHEIALSRERMKKDDLAIEQSRARTRIILDQLFKQLGMA